MQQSRRTVIGVFDEPAMADRAVQALESAGFSSAQIHRHGHQASGGFLAGLRNLFGGDNDTDVSAREFTDMGVSNEEATYYENESQAGRSIVTVRADGREEEAMSLLRENGAYNYGTRRGGTGIASAGTTTRTGDVDTYNNTTTTGTTGATAYDNTVDRTRRGDTEGYDNTVDRTRRGDTAAYDNTVDRTRTGDATAYDNTVDRTGAAREGYADTDEARRLRLREEQLDVNKQRAQAGEVGLHKEVINEEKAIDVPVTHEEAYVERRPVTDATANDNTPIGEGETIRVPLSEERANVNKNTVVTGEVEVGKRAVTENQRVSDTVRREEARLERDGDVPVRGNEDDRIRRDRTNDRTNEGNL